MSNTCFVDQYFSSFFFCASFYQRHSAQHTCEFIATTKVIWNSLVSMPVPGMKSLLRVSSTSVLIISVYIALYCIGHHHCWQRITIVGRRFGLRGDGRQCCSQAEHATARGLQGVKKTRVKGVSFISSLLFFLFSCFGFPFLFFFCFVFLLASLFFYFLESVSLRVFYDLLILIYVMLLTCLYYSIFHYIRASWWGAATRMWWAWALRSQFLNFWRGTAWLPTTLTCGSWTRWCDDDNDNNYCPKREHWRRRSIARKQQKRLLHSRMLPSLNICLPLRINPNFFPYSLSSHYQLHTYLFLLQY